MTSKNTVRNDPIKPIQKIWLPKVLFLCVTVANVLAQSPTNTTLEANCLACHREQKLPDNLIYRRYLLRYSSAKRIEKALSAYLKHPRQEASIMPAEFFLRFPMREPLKMDDQTLHRYVRKYIDYFDVRKRLRMEQ